MTIKTILLATDGSAASEHALNFAASLAKIYKAKVIVVHAFAGIPTILGEPHYSEALHKTLGAAQALARQMVERLSQAGVSDVEPDVIEGSPVDVILKVGRTRRADLIVMGARGLSKWQGVILGSVSMGVVQRAECPVLVVK